MILVLVSLYRTRLNNNHPILDDSSHPLLDGVNWHPILDDSSHPLLDGVNYHSDCVLLKSRKSRELL